MLANSLLTLLLLLLAAGVSEAQTRRRRPARPVVDYSQFSHVTKKHQAACNTCHLAPTKDWMKVSAYPDVADYPGHDACVSCHRAQFFKGARPPICSVCHSKTSPRDYVRFEFRNPASKLQFTSEFPHDRHQDVIASLLQPRRRIDLAHALGGAPNVDDKQNYNNCTICHAQLTAQPKAPAAGWLDGFVPQPATFKAVPTNHSSCFNCHWKSQQPVADDCNGCHKPATPYLASNVPVRISFKFMHEGGGEKGNHILECTACHINITKAATLRGLKPDVPITSCTECHNREGLRQDVSRELVAIDKDRGFVCVYCHTSNVGKLDPPASHYLIAERPPLKRRDIK